ncbi:MAG: helix-turn-helix domain-containing protein [Alphaproteobacteria bacterium]|nr:helix-turn-helix domain-containing protein [Alphaproteobacteria bacterium]MDE6570622.1 helix-turn-helix domain-containing protein [Alphaproteobacteria bacterium]
MGGKRQYVTEFDKRLGHLIVIHRMRYGLSQKDLAAALDCSFQQIQKYESAANRMSVARLHMLCKYLKISPGQFLQEADAPYVHDPRISKIMLNLYKLSEERVKLILELTDAMVAAKKISIDELI